MDLDSKRNIVLNIGDEVIDIHGDRGVITKFCDCDLCRDRGFYEPVIKSSDYNCNLYISNYDMEGGYSIFYKIGDNIFPEHVNEFFLKLYINNEEAIIKEATEKAIRLKTFLEEVQNQK